MNRREFLRRVAGVVVSASVLDTIPLPPGEVTATAANDLATHLAAHRRVTQSLYGDILMAYYLPDVRATLNRPSIILDPSPHAPVLFTQD